MSTSKKPFFIEYLSNHGFFDAPQDSKPMEKDHLIRYLLNIFEAYSKSKDFAEFPVHSYCRYINQKNSNNSRQVKKITNNIAVSIQHYCAQSSEIAYYYDILNQQKYYSREVASYLRCRKAILEFFPGKLSLDDLVLSLETWTTLLKRLRKENTSNEVLNRFKDKILETQEALLSERQDAPRSVRLKPSSRSDKLEINAVNFVKLYLNEFPPAPLNLETNKKPLQEISMVQNAYQSQKPPKSQIQGSQPTTNITARPTVANLSRIESQDRRFTDASLDLSIIKPGPIQSTKTEDTYFDEVADTARLLEKINKASSLLTKDQVIKNQVDKVFPKKKWSLGNQSNYAENFEDQLDRSIERLQFEDKMSEQDDLVNKMYGLLQKGQESKEHEKNPEKLQEETEERETQESRRVLQESLRQYEKLENEYENVYSFFMEMQNSLVNVIIPKLKAREPELFELLDLRFIDNYLQKNPVKLEKSLREEELEYSQTNDGSSNTFSQSIFMCDPNLMDQAKILSEKVVVCNRKLFKSKEGESSMSQMSTQQKYNSNPSEECETQEDDTERELTEEIARLRQDLDAMNSYNNERILRGDVPQSKGTENPRKSSKSPSLNQYSKSRLKQNSRCPPRSLGEELARHKKNQVKEREDVNKKENSSNKVKSKSPIGRDRSRGALTVKENKQCSLLSSFATSTGQSYKNTLDTEQDELFTTKESYGEENTKKNQKISDNKENCKVSVKPKGVLKQEKKSVVQSQQIQNIKPDQKYIGDAKGKWQPVKQNSHPVDLQAFTEIEFNVYSDNLYESIEKTEEQKVKFETAKFPFEMKALGEGLIKDEDASANEILNDSLENDDGPNFGVNVYAQQLERLRNKRTELESRSLLVRSTQNPIVHHKEEKETQNKGIEGNSASKLEFINQFRSNQSESSRDVTPKENNLLSLIKDIKGMINYSSVGSSLNMSESKDPERNESTIVDEQDLRDEENNHKEAKGIFSTLEQVPEVDNRELELETERRVQQASVELENFWSFQKVAEQESRPIKDYTEQEEIRNEESLECFKIKDEGNADDYLIYDTRDLEEHFVDAPDIDLGGTGTWGRSQAKNKIMMDKEDNKEEGLTSDLQLEEFRKFAEFIKVMGVEELPKEGGDQWNTDKQEKETVDIQNFASYQSFSKPENEEKSVDAKKNIEDLEGHKSELFIPQDENSRFQLKPDIERIENDENNNQFLKKTPSAPKFKMPNLLTRKSCTAIANVVNESGRSSSVLERRESTCSNREEKDERSPLSSKLRKPSFASRIKSITKDLSSKELKTSQLSHEDSLFEPSFSENQKEHTVGKETERIGEGVFFKPAKLLSSKQRSASLIAIHKPYQSDEQK